ncbi:MAG: hypothetical protein Q9218_004326 [Villophora microphyllina]
MVRTIQTKIDIAASPATVRHVFLDFAKYPAWSTEGVTSITIVTSDRSDGSVAAGDIIKATAGGMTFKPKILENTQEVFRWLGSSMGLSGEHRFHFQANAAGGTTFIQEEEFFGLMGIIMREGWTPGRKTEAGFKGFNRCLKARAEAVELEEVKY